MSVPTVVVVNESTVVDDILAWRIAWSLQFQVDYHFGPSWKTSARVKFIPKGASVPVGSWILHLLDTADQQGALGYHDEDGNRVPYARVFCKTAQDNGSTPSEVASHELLEMLVDPHINDTSPTADLKRLYAKEVGDPCQGNGYGIGALGNQLIVADFALPGYFDPQTPANVPTDFRGKIEGPFAIAPQGYMSWVDLTDVSKGWQQSLGAERTSAPVDLDDRLARRTA